MAKLTAPPNYELSISIILPLANLPFRKTKTIFKRYLFISNYISKNSYEQSVFIVTVLDNGQMRPNFAHSTCIQAKWLNERFNPTGKSTYSYYSLDRIYYPAIILLKAGFMVAFLAKWEVEYTDEFELWWDNLSALEQVGVAAKVKMLAERGPALGDPHTSAIKGSPFPLRELKVQQPGRPLRILYVFDPRRTALLLIGGDKTGDNRWYERMVPLAEKLYQQHLQSLTSSSES